ncbi:MAG: CGNR zinc finger domain-containing protein [Pseudomonadota bacterium]
MDFVDTLAERMSSPRDLLRQPRDLEVWIASAGLGRVASVSDNQLRQSKELREFIHEAVSSAVEGRKIPKSAIVRINKIARQPGLRPQYVDGRVVLQAENPFDAALSSIAADAIENIAPANRARLRRCLECQMLFRDNSRPGRRQWCSSSSGCGNRAKVRRHRAKLKEQQSR